MINCHIMPSCMNTIEKILCDTGDEPSENLKKKNGIFDCICNFFFENIFNKSLTVNYEIIHERSTGKS